MKPGLAQISCFLLCVLHYCCVDAALFVGMRHNSLSSKKRQLGTRKFIVSRPSFVKLIFRRTIVNRTTYCW